MTSAPQTAARETISSFSKPSYHPLNVKDALSYLNKVKITINKRPLLYNRFLQIMQDLKKDQYYLREMGRSNGRINILGVMEQISDLFHGYPDLIQGFNSFLPSGYSIEYSDPMGSKYIRLGLPPEVATVTGTNSNTSPATISTPTSSKMPEQNVSPSEKTRKRARCRYVIYVSDLIT